MTRSTVLTAIAMLVMAAALPAAWVQVNKYNLIKRLRREIN
jgi:hypothetical protein